jgi:FkbM family methyltransferase
MYKQGVRLRQWKESAKVEIDIEKALEQYLLKNACIEHKTEQARQEQSQLQRIHRYAKEWLKKAKKYSIGYKLSDKLKLIEIAFLDSIPTPIRKRNSALDLFASSLADHLCAKLTIKLDDIIYTIRDAESLRILSHEFEPFLLQWLQPKAGEVFVDIGAHLGKHAIAVSKLVGSEGQVIAMEAIPANFTSLKKNIELNKLKNIISFNIAAWNRRCELKFFKGSTSANANINRHDYGFGNVKAQAERPDKLLLDNIGLKRVDWIKIDVEGAEYEVMLGLEETLTRFRPTLFVEVWSQNMSKVKAFLKKHNYRIDRVSEFGKAQSQYYVEALFVPN